MPRDSDREDRPRRNHRDRTEGQEPDRRERQYRSDTERRRTKVKGHLSTDSTGALLPREPISRDDADSEEEQRRRGKERRESRREKPGTSTNTSSQGQTLSISNLQALTNNTRDSGWQTFGGAARKGETKERPDRRSEEKKRERRTDATKIRRVISESVNEPGRSSQHDERRRSSRPVTGESDRDEDRRRRRRERVVERDAIIQDDRRRRSRRRDISHHEPKRKTHRVGGYDEVDEFSDSEGDRRLEIPSPVVQKMRLRGGEDEYERKTRRKRRGEDEYDKRGARVVSGPLLEKGAFDAEFRSYDTSYATTEGTGANARRFEWFHRNRHKLKRYRYLILAAIIALIAIIVIAVVVGSKKDKSGSGSSSDSSSSGPSNANLNNINPSSIPASAKGTYYDPFSWYDTDYFNLTYTTATVGGLPIMGLNSTWDDTVQANPNVPALKDSFAYGSMPIRGMNLGGWLSIEPFITPSFFQKFNSRDNIIDEYTLSTKLGSMQAKSTLEAHYSSFVSPSTLQEIRAAGFDHVRIPFSYWAVTTYDGDPYVPMVSWRYLLRAIEWARQNGLRVNLDLHGLPGSQNGWNHSGRQGYVGWLNGTDGVLNGQRSLDIHNQLSTFFAQPRYKNLVTMYGLANEPRMTGLDTAKVLNWTQTAISQIRSNGITAVIVFGDGFMGLDNWQGKLQSDNNLLLDVHQYVIFNNDQMNLDHSDKITFACKGWTQQMTRSMDKTTGFGATMCGEWSQADTDCAMYLNDVGIGSRWEGTLNTGNLTTSVLTPQCPTRNNPKCECDDANAAASSYSAAYKNWLLYFALAQMDSFEKGWGWFYWTWETENAVQWSWRKGMAAGILPTDIRKRDWTCSSSNGVPDYAYMGLAETY